MAAGASADLRRGCPTEISLTNFSLRRRSGCRNCIGRSLSCSLDRDGLWFRGFQDPTSRRMLLYQGQCRACKEDGLYCPMTGIQEARRIPDEDRPEGSLDFYDFSVPGPGEAIWPWAESDSLAVVYERSTFPDTQLASSLKCPDASSWMKTCDQYVDDRAYGGRRIIGCVVRPITVRGPDRGGMLTRSRATRARHEGSGTVDDIFYLITAKVGSPDKPVRGAPKAPLRPGNTDTAYWVRAAVIRRSPSSDEQRDVVGPSRVATIGYEEQSYGVAMGLQCVGIDLDAESGMSLFAKDPSAWENVNKYKLRLAIAKRASWNTPSEVDEAIRLQHPAYTSIPPCALRRCMPHEGPSAQEADDDRQLGRIVGYV